MPKVHNIGKQHFVQYIHFPVKWKYRLFVRGWTQEIAEPFRTAKPLILRLPKHKAVVFGKWTGAQPDEETALNNAMQGRLLTDEDFTEEKGWTAAPNKTREESKQHSDT